MTRQQDRSTIDLHIWRHRIRPAVAARANFRCECCGQYVARHGQVDHIIPRADCEAAGIHPLDMTNLQYLCIGCHSEKTNRERWAGKPKADLRTRRRYHVKGRDNYFAAILKPDPAPQDVGATDCTPTQSS